MSTSTFTIIDNVIVRGLCNWEREEAATKLVSAKFRQRKAVSSKRFASIPVSWALEDYTRECAGVSPFVIGKVFRSVRGHSMRLSVLGTALLVAAENPTMTPARLFSVSMRRTLRKMSKIGFSGCCGRTERRMLANCDQFFDLPALVATVCDDSVAVENERISSLVLMLVRSLNQGLGDALADGLSIGDAAERCGIHVATAYRAIDRVRSMLTSAA